MGLHVMYNISISRYGGALYEAYIYRCGTRGYRLMLAS